MRFIVWGINYAPEVTGIGPYNTALCDYLRERGHEVSMVTAFAYYPVWKKLAADRRTLYRSDSIRGVPVHRCWQFVPRRSSVLKRILHESSFVITSWLRLLTLPRADVLIVISPPLLLGMAAWLISLLKRRPFIFHVQDLQPDAALGLGILRPSLFTRGLFALETLAYNRAARVSGISAGMLSAFARKGLPPQKAILFPNGVELVPGDTLPRPGGFRRRQHLSPGDFLVVYSGNLGAKQGLQILLTTAAMLPDSRIQIILCGEGVQRELLEDQVRSSGLKNLRLLPLQSEEHYQEMLVDTNLSVITQQPGSGGCFFPSKLLRNLAVGRPVLTVADSTSELARVVAEGGFGINVEPDRPEEIAHQLQALANSPDRLRLMGQAGRHYVEQFESRRVFSAFEAELLRFSANERRRAPG